MKSRRITRIAAWGFVALLPLTLAVNSASAAPRHHHDDLFRGYHSPFGTFKVAPGITKSVVSLKKPAEYMVCASVENADPVVVHFDGKKNESLRAGECHDFEAAEIKIENLGKSGFAYGTFFKNSGMSDEEL